MAYISDTTCTGLGCVGKTDCGCGCSSGLGLFDSGLDVSQWGAMEWGALALGVYVLFSVFSTTQRTVGKARRMKRAYRSAARELSK